MKCKDNKFVRIIRIEEVLKAFNMNLTFPEFLPRGSKASYELPKADKRLQWKFRPCMEFIRLAA
jgi:hypothetical protein